MTTIQRLADSCLTVSTDDGTTLFDPGFFTFGSSHVDLSALGEVQRVLVTHEHADHVHADFVRWLIDRGDDVEVHGNAAVANLLAQHGIEVHTDDPEGVSSEDVVHETTPMGTAPPNRSYTVEGALTHPGDSYQPTRTAPVLALPLIIPWGSTTKSIEFAKRLQPAQVVPIHDFYLEKSGRDFIYGMAKRALAPAGIELVPLGWGEGYTL